ncbi:enoyl-acyl carrier reductase [Eimeria tenella]|uniref:Enoyl-acyl carrier reductase n=1 Tax=Eimeria tenella TaxID=5802 RepID=U6L421_EIMTE|nr:enoyl-acyl carrier reductase [Eimeria tenella]CDJ42500.1 enoyl-acyl carrier reductase [Eimeria tenella]|eukprot:XP_013233250.1 enoyl-acyl carrier reductase [Eimeria tenella]
MTRFLVLGVFLMLLLEQQQGQLAAAFRVGPGPEARGAELQQRLRPTAAVPTASQQQQPVQQVAVVPRGVSSSSSSSTAAAAGPTGTAEPLSGPLPVDLRGKTAFVAGVADSNGYGWAICKLLRAAGARVLVGTWPPVYSIFKKGLESSRFEQDSFYAQEPSSKVAAEAAEKPVDLVFDKIYPLDAVFDTPQDVSSNKRYAGVDGFTISEVAEAVRADVGQIDILVHSLANGPEVTKPLLQTSRKGYLAAVSSSSYSFVSLLQHFLPLMKEGGSALALSYIASEKVIPGYGGGMSSAKAALESDCRTLAFEAGRARAVRVNCISAGPLKSRAASAIGKAGDKTFIDLAIDYSEANAPLQKELESDDVGRAALFLLSPLARAVTGATLYVDNGLHAMGQALDSKSLTP